MRIGFLCVVAAFMSIVEMTGSNAQYFRNQGRHEIIKLSEWGQKEGMCGPYILYRDDARFAGGSHYAFMLRAPNGRWGMRSDIIRSQLDAVIDPLAEVPAAGPVKDRYGAWRYIIWLSPQDFAEAPCLRDLEKTR